MNDVLIKTIVLAEDDKDDHIFFSEALMQLDPSLKLTTVNNGNELMDLLQHYYPDILFLDLDMPYKNGLECLKEIRANERLKDLPVIVFSSTSRPVNIETAYEMGCDLFFIKPSGFNKLLEAVEKILAFDWKQRHKIKQQFISGSSYKAFTST